MCHRMVGARILCVPSVSVTLSEASVDNLWLCWTLHSLTEPTQSDNAQSLALPKLMKIFPAVQNSAINSFENADSLCGINGSWINTQATIAFTAFHPY